jgi:hypothetical protein
LGVGVHAIAVANAICCGQRTDHSCHRCRAAARAMQRISVDTVSAPARTACRNQIPMRSRGRVMAWLDLGKVGESTKAIEC